MITIFLINDNEKKHCDQNCENYKTIIFFEFFFNFFFSQWFTKHKTLAT